MDVVDVGVEELDIVLDGHGGLAFLHFEFLGVDGEGDILGGGGIEIDETVGGDGVVALAAGDEDPLVGAAAGDAVVALGDVVFNLGVVDLEGGGELRRGRGDEHQVPAAGDGESVGDGLVGFDLVEA